ncbi:GH92 family glycosyl hydrolase [Mucilaginibacter terrae]|uniref:Alpha-1,2-mannosidase n=1 Tax=Mucilaginibacter terrae TaxID=1955052 RepID=A0ABU3GRE2_9SPHI|nr:GH92 family glycosyl hydrolase [Mucilaginibacter terrae]MDT3402353.1 putative alpha-1,2-mannosidase [Mucilaginibacter terrae]
MKYLPFLVSAMLSLVFSIAQAQNTVWKIGEADDSSAGLALAPNKYAHFLDHDFGWEDRYFLIGYSNPATDWPYALPGPKDGWGGTGPTSGVRSNSLNILFGLENAPVKGKYSFEISFAGIHSKFPPLLKVLINGRSYKYRLPKRYNDKAIEGDTTGYVTFTYAIPFTDSLLKKGGNEIQLTTLDGSWLMFDQVRLQGPVGVKLIKPKDFFVREVKVAAYEMVNNGKRYQPLLVDVQHLTGKPKLTVKLDGKQLFAQQLDSARYQFEVLMPAVSSAKTSKYEILKNGVVIQTGSVQRSPKALFTYADYANTTMGTGHSRWMIAPGPWMPFSMVKISPDNQNSGWSAGYDPIHESIGTFSHIHEWTMAALGTFPTSGTLKTRIGDESDKGDGYRSKIDKSTEKAPVGYYSVLLTDHNIKAELTATTRCSFQRYTYPKGIQQRVMVDLKVPAEYDYQLKNVSLKQTADNRLEGYSEQFSKDVWSGINQEYTVHFVMEFNRPIKQFGTWVNDDISEKSIDAIASPKFAGAFVEFDESKGTVVQVRTGISLVSIENAAKNLNEEVTVPFGWSFDKVHNAHRDAWNKLFARLQVNTNDYREKMRFYTNMYRALASRNTWSDIDGRWVDASKKVQQFTDKTSVALGCDAFWNTFWNLNQFWNMVTPEWSSKWVKSQLAMYDADGWLAKGPAGMNYIPVMVAEHEIPLIVGAYQMGIRDFDAEKAFAAAYKMQTTPAQRVGKAGHAGNDDLVTYLEHKYVPYDKGRFSNSLEYSFDDWTVSQFAKALGKQKEFEQFKERGNYWRNVIDKETGYARLKKSDGSWMPGFDPFKSGANEHYVEGNAWQLTYFVPQDVPALANTIGVDKFTERLSWGFTESDKLRFNAPGDQYWDYPVIQGNQQSMHFAFLFNWMKKPWLTQRWSRTIVDRFYGYGASNAYLGDEDQGQMSAWFIMNAIGLFQTDGGTHTQPIYEIGSPIFSKITIGLGRQYGRGKSFTIVAKNASRTNKYVQQAVLNGKLLNNFWFPAQELLKGGELVLTMGDKPNTNWGVGALPKRD